MYKYKINDTKKINDIGNKYVIEDENSFNAFINYLENNPNCEVVFYAFDGSSIERKLFFYLKTLEHLVKLPPCQLEIRSDSALILIALPILKKISQIVRIELTAVRGSRPEEIIKAAKAIREHNLPVKVRYLKRLN